MFIYVFIWPCICGQNWVISKFCLLWRRNRSFSILKLLFRVGWKSVVHMFSLWLPLRHGMQNPNYIVYKIAWVCVIKSLNSLRKFCRKSRPNDRPTIIIFIGLLLFATTWFVISFSVSSFIQNECLHWPFIALVKLIFI